MNWLTPLAFGALGALAVPLLLHLAALIPKDTVPFPSLAFLRRTQRRRRRLRRIRDPWLLALRALAVLLLIAAFAEPVLTDRTPAVDPGAAPALVLVDRSASMSRLADFEVVRGLASESVEELSGRPIALATFDTRFDLLVPFGAEFGEVASAVEALSPGAGRGALDTAVSAAGRLLADQSGGGGTLVIISDLQGAAELADGPVYVPGGLEVVVRQPPAVPAVRRVSNARLRGLNAARVRLEVDVLDTAGGDDLVLSGASGVLETRPSQASATARRVTFDLVRATDRDEPLTLSFGDAEPSWFGVLPALPPRRVVLLDGATPRETLFLERALALGESDSIRVLDRSALDRADVLIGALDRLVDSADVPVHLARGGAVLAMPPADQTPFSAPDWLPVQAPVWHEPASPVRLASVVEGHVLATVLGGDEGTVGGARPVWRYLRGDRRPDTLVPLAFDDGRPALVVGETAGGTVALMTAGAAPPGSELGLGEYFAPLVVGLVRSLTPRPDRPVSHSAGEALDLRPLFTAGIGDSITVREPDGSQVTLRTTATAIEPGSTGHFRARAADGARRLVAVNVPDEEWRTARQDPNQWRESVSALPSQGRAENGALRDGESARDRPLSVLLLFAALALFVFESFVANFLTRRRAGAEVLT